MANILAIETSSVYCSIGLKKNEDFFFEHSKEENSHGKSILSFIDLILKKAGLKKNQIDFIALSVGPGSFTGLRVGCSVAQGLALGLEKKILPFSSLQVLAQNFFLENSCDEVYLVKEAHMNDLYVGHYHADENNLAIEAKEDTSIKKENLINFIPLSTKEIICSDCLEQLNYLGKEQLTPFINHAKGLLHLAFHSIELEKNLKLPEQIYPIYLSGSDQWKKAK